MLMLVLVTSTSIRGPKGTRKLKLLHQYHKIFEESCKLLRLAGVMIPIFISFDRYSR